MVILCESSIELWDPSSKLVKCALHLTRTIDLGRLPFQPSPSSLLLSLSLSFFLPFTFTLPSTFCLPHLLPSQPSLSQPIRNSLTIDPLAPLARIYTDLPPFAVCLPSLARVQGPVPNRLKAEAKVKAPASHPKRPYSHSVRGPLGLLRLDPWMSGESLQTSVQQLFLNTC